MHKVVARKLRRARALPADRLFLLLRHRLWNRVRSLYDATHPYALNDETLLAAFGGVFPSSDDLACYARLQPFEVTSTLPDKKAELVHTLRRLAPVHVTQTLVLADAVCEHTVDLLGSGPTELGAEIDWYADFKTGWRWPLVPSRNIIFDDLDQSYDVKVPWELSRCQLLVTLGQARCLSGEERYAEACLELLASWLRHNPVGYGVNWACTMDVAIRAVNLVWVGALLHDSVAFDSRWRKAFYKTLFEHGTYIARNLEIGRVLGNHYLADVVGMAWLGLTLPPCPRTRRWRDHGLAEIWREVLHQFYIDGVNFESSISYHRLSLEMVLHILVLCRHKGVTVPDAVRQRVEQALVFVAAYTRQDGSVPQFGDADNGRLLRLDTSGTPDEFNDHRSLLGIGAWYFSRADFAAAAGDKWAEAIWLGGHEWPGGATIAGESRLSQGFRQGGVYIQRSGDAQCAISAMPNGQDGNGGHAHNDLLGFELHAAGTTFLRDAGTYVYTADYRARNRFRATRAHNTIEVDGQEQRRIAARLLFEMSDPVTVQVHHWQCRAHEDLFDGSHRGYTRLPSGVVHRRQILFDKASERWLVRDLILGTGRHTARLWLHFDAIPVEAWPVMPLALRALGGRAELLVVPVFTSGLTLEMTNSAFSQRYGVQEQAPAACYTMYGEAPLECAMALIVVRGNMPTADALCRWSAPVLARLRSMDADNDT